MRWPARRTGVVRVRNLRTSIKIACVCLLTACLAAYPQAALADDDDGDGGENDGGENGGEHGLGDQAQIQITGSIPAICQFTTLPSQSSIGTIASGAVAELGSLGFTCNMAMSGAVNLTVVSANGALRREGDTQTIAYEVAWNIQGQMDNFETIPVNPTGFNLLSGPGGVEQLGAYKVKITGPATDLPAGIYEDTLTYTISP